MKNFYPHPIFILFCIFYIFIGKHILLFSTIIALFIHELGHYLTAKHLGFLPDGFSLTPFGATMSYNNGLSDKNEFYVTVFGPFFNLLFCALIPAFWWFFPAIYPYTIMLSRACFALCVFNLIPVFPFDGGRIILSLSKNKLKTLKILRIVGFCVSSISFVLGIIAIFFHFCYVFFFIGSVVLWNCIFDAPKQRYHIIFQSMCSFPKTYAYEKKDIYINKNALLSSLIKSLKRPNTEYTVHIIGEKKEILVYGENLNSLYFKDRKLTVADAISTLPL